MNTSPLPSLFVRKFVTIERVLALLILAGVIFKMNHWPLAGFILVLAFGSLATCYFFMAKLLDPPQTPESRNIMLTTFASRFIYWGFSLAIVGILFKIMRWPNANFMLFLGCAVIVGLTLLALRIQMKINLVRVLIVLAAAAFLHFAPERKLIEMGIHHPSPRDTSSAVDDTN